MFRKSPYVLVVTVACLVALGIVMLFSTAAFAAKANGDMYHFVKRQAVFGALGIFVATACAVLDYRAWQKLAIPAIGATILLLALIYTPVGHTIGGARRWLDIGFTFQPSDFAKISLFVFLAAHYARPAREIAGLVKGTLVPAGVLGLVCGLIIMQTDLGTTILLGGVGLIVMFIAGARLGHLVPLSGLACVPVGLILAHNQERMERIIAFLDPSKHPEQRYQQDQAIMGLQRGGWFGAGLGNSIQKFGNLPEAHTDFLPAIIGEELGVFVMLLLVLAYVVILVFGLLIASHSRDRFGQLLGYGLTLVITCQAAINLGVVFSLLPNKGLPLPFISYGGTNMIICLAAVGILLNIYRSGLEISPTAERKLLEARISPRL
jgi:cell division protein FtsW